ncbi:uncharacterized protein [Lepeophtheirus salmonis]|uniref:uncharacterized protein isoform X5 n=1 Tax=Lepeophtheirus salmonis TaxID=72036 RepID=UPI003AF333F6
MSNLSLLGETSTSMSDLSNGRGPATLCKPSSKSALPVDALHFAVWYGRTTEVKKLIIEGGLNIEVLNNHGQTPLFVAAYIQNYFSVKTLLQLGANPNGRSVAGYTPTHAACYSGSKKILNKILEAGGDLRLHDENHCTPIDWALWQSDGEKRLRIMELIETARRCTMKQSGKEALVEKNFSRNFGGRASLTTLFKKKLPVKGGKNGKQEVDMGELVKNIHAMGFGKIYFGNGLKAAAISTIPYIDASDLSPDRHYPTYSSGSFTEMSSKLWLHTRVTVRSLLEPPPSGALVDILISELEALCKLTHPQILLLMGVCQTKNYEGLMLVFEHVQLGSLYYCLHEKDCMPKIKNAVDIILQIVDALIYLHSHGWLHCSLTSHAVHLVGPNVAKLSSFELAVEDKEETRRNRTFDLLSDKGWQSIYNWLCPDILRGEPPSKCGDLYSLCCLIWEISTGQVPWGNLDPDEILVEIKLKGHSLPLDKKYIPKHLMMVLEQGLKLRGDERDVDLHEIRDMLILTRKDAVKNEKKFNSNQSHQNTSSSVHRDSSTTDSGVWLGSGNQPMRSYSSSAIQRSPQSSHSSHSYNYCHHSAEEDDGNSQKNIDEFTGLRKTSSILKRKKYEKTFGSFPAKGFSSSHQDVDSNYDYVKNRAKRHFLRNGSVSKNDYIRKTANKSDEDLRRRSLSSLYHATLVASDKYNGIDLLSSSEHSSSTSDLSPYYSGDSLSGDITSQPEKRRSVSPEIGILRSRSVPRTNSSTIPVSNSAAEFVAAHLQEANKRGYGRTFSNLSQKSRENLDENTDDHFRESKLGLSSFKSSNKFSNRSNDIKPASHAIQRNSPSPIKNVPSSSNQLPTKNNKKDLVSSMSKLNLHIPVPASKPQVSSLASSIIHKNKSSSAIRSPLGAFKEAYQSCAEKSTDLVTRKTKSLASLPKLTASKFDANTYELKPDDIDAIRIIEESGKSEAQSKLNEQKRTLGKADRNADQIGSSSGKSFVKRKPSGDIVRSADRVSSPPRSQWSTKGVQNLIQNLESIQQQKLEEQQQVQNNTLYQTAPSEFLISSNNRSSNHNLPKPEGKESILEYNNSTNNFEASNNNNDAIEDNNLICFDAPAKSDNPDTVWNNNDIYGSNQVANSDWTKNSNSMNNNQNNIYTTQCDNFGSGNNEIPDCYNNFSGNVDTQTTPYNDNSPSKQDINNDSYSQPNYQDNYVNLNSENDLQYNYKNHGDDIQQQQINNDLNTIDAHTPMNDQYNNQDVHGSLVIGSNNPQEEQFDNVNSGNSQDLHWDIDGNDQSNNNVDGSSMNVWTTVKENNSVGLCSNDLENNCNVPYNNNSICPYNAENPSANTFQDVNLTQQEIDNHTNEYNNNNQFLNEKSSDANRVPSSQNILSVHQLNCSIDPCSCTPRQSPILKSAGLSPSHPFALRTSTPNEYNSHKLHKTMQDAYTSALAEAIEEEEITRDVENSSLNNSECWNTADSDMILFQQQHSGVRSSAMVRHMEKKLKKKSSQKQILKDVESKRETNNVTFNSEVLEISNSVSTQTLDADMSSRRTSAASSFVSQPDTEDLYCDDELNPSLENDPNMQLTISRALESEDTTDFPQTPIFNDFDSILSMDTPSTGPTSLRSEYSEDKDTYNTASSSSDEEDNSVSGDIEVEIASENTRDDENVNYQNGSSIEDSEEHFTTTSSQ